VNPNDPEYLNRLLKQLNPDVLRAAEATMLKADIANLQRQCDLSVAAVIDGYKTSIAPLVERLAELERIHAGEQTSLFGASFRRGMEEGHELVKDSPFNAAMNYAAKYPASQEPIGPVIPCSTYDAGETNSTMPVGDEASKATAVGNVEKTDGFKSTFNGLSDWLDNNPEAMYHTPKNAQVVTRDGQTFFVFKSAGYKAITERLGFPYREYESGLDTGRYLLTPKEYHEVFSGHL